MQDLRKNPHLYEINLMPWLEQVCDKGPRNCSIGMVPPTIWEDLKNKGMDLIWLMGMWHRSVDARNRARNEPRLIQACHAIVTDFKINDIGGSPYAIDQYCPDPGLGSEQDLKTLKKTFEDMGLFLILDFVPNHTACDHAWIQEHPEYYIHTRLPKNSRCKKGFFLSQKRSQNLCIAHGRDPHFYPWTDTAQINYCNPGAVRAMLNTLTKITHYCHGLRCDMAMLVLNDVFKKTWRRHVDKTVNIEFWTQALDRLKSDQSDCILLAEVYWNKENKLIDMGFDYTYDKIFYDLTVDANITGLRKHLAAPVYLQEKMIRFLENHDEPRAMDVFGEERIFSAMIIHATLPGMRFWHQGQFEGRCIKIPVQLRRAPFEPIHAKINRFSQMLLREVNHDVFHDGKWRMCVIKGWWDNPTHRNLLSWCWQKGKDRRLIVVNFAPRPSQGLVVLPEQWIFGSKRFHCIDPIKDEKYTHDVKEVKNSGCYVALEKWDFHFFRIVTG